MAAPSSESERGNNVDAKLPINLSARDSKKYPQFVSLLKSLECELSPSGISSPLNKDLEEVKIELNQIKLQYFQQLIVYNEVKELLFQYHVDQKKKLKSRTDVELYKILQETLSTAEAKQYLNLSLSSEGAETKLFGLSEDKLQIKPKRKRDVHQVLQQHFIPEIERQLKERCISLIRFWDSKSQEDSDGLALAKATQLPAILQRQLNKLEEQEKKLKLEKLESERQFQQYYQAICRSLEVLEQLISKHRLKSQVDNTKVTVEWLGAKCDGICSKIRVLQYQLLKDTYTVETVAALKKVRNSLDVALQDSKTELARIKELLNVYESVGPGFEALVKQYTQLTAQIDNKKWALSELKRTQQAS